MSTKPLAQQVVPGADGAESANAEDGAVRPRDSLFHWCGTADSVRRATERPQKCALLEAYFGAVAESTIGPAARFFTGLVLPRHDPRPLGVDAPLIVEVIQDLTRIPGDELRARSVKHGDLGDAAAEAFAGRLPSGLSVPDVALWAGALAGAMGASERRAVLRDMFARLSGLEAQYVVKLIAGELRIGVKEALVEEALAKAFSQPVASVRRANLLRDDIGEVAILARRRDLDQPLDDAPDARRRA
jgi:DNA ligase-1